MKFILFFILFINILFAKDVKDISLQLLWKHQFEFAGYYMAKEKGFYKEKNINVNFKEYKHSIDIVEDVQSGKSDFGIGYPNIILDYVNGANIKLIDAIFQSSPHILVTLDSSSIKTIKDFKNRNIMIEDDSIKTASILSMLYSNNIYLDDMKISKPSFNIDDLLNNKIDIFSSYLSNEIYYLKEKNLKYKIWNPKDYGFDFYNDILFTSDSFIKKNNQTVSDFKKASLKGWEYAFDNIEETVKIILEKYNTQNKSKKALIYEANILKELAYENGVKLGDIDKNKIQRIYDIYNLMGLVKNNININNILYRDVNLEDSTSLDFTKNEKEYLENNKIIKMCNNPNWAPIEFAKDNDMNNMRGVSIDTLKILEKRLDIKFENIPTKSWSESQQFLKDKKCDILPSAIKTKKREKYAIFTKPYLDYKLAIITQTKKPFVNSIEDILDKSIARKKDSGLIMKLKERYSNINILETKGYLESLQSVSNGEAYCTIATLPVVSYYINKFSINNLQIAGYTDMRYKLSIAVRDDKPILLDIFNKALSKITQKEKIDISERWVTVNIKEQVDYTFIRNILFVILIAILFLIYRHYLLKRSYKDLELLVKEKTKELRALNNNLEKRIKDEVKKNLMIQEQLFKSEKMVAIGEMIGNIAHQWRQPLSIISTATTGMKMQKELGILSDEFFIQSCDNINRNAQYLSQTIDDFRNFIKDDRVLSNFKLDKNIDNFLHLVDGPIKSNNINVIINIDKDIYLDGYFNELLQCYINIFVTIQHPSKQGS
ncbi:MAG: ABC transporter substrate-binding protein [Campylobacterota bacterium]|nr:ABC transporter substrate-binding protein [Campylobacterota bacterium]